MSNKNLKYYDENRILNIIILLEISFHRVNVANMSSHVTGEI